MDTIETAKDYLSQLNAIFFTLAREVDSSKPLFQFSLAFIAFNPIFWNIVARFEYYTHFLTKAFGSKKAGCYALAVTIFSLGLARDYVYKLALAEQPSSSFLLDNVWLSKYLAVTLFTTGNILVLSSMWALGITGTYLGDYFGILMEHRVTGFPFNVTDNPMYNGSFLCFMGTALWYGKPAGIFVALFVQLMYSIALLFEEPFTEMIYQKKAASEAKKQK